jgi:cytochrome c-type biogenesis protein
VVTGLITADPLGVLVAFGAGILSFLSPCVLPLVPGYLSMITGLSASELEARGPAPSSASRSAPFEVRAMAGSGGATTESVPVDTAPGDAASVGTALVDTALVDTALVDTALVDTAPTMTTPDDQRSVDVAPGQDGVTPGPPLAPLLRGIALFVGGFTVVFVSLGAAASGLGHLLGAHKQALTLVAGGVVVALGVVLLLGALPAGFWARIGAGRAAVVGRLIGDRRFQVRPSALGAWAAPIMGMAFAFAWTPCIGPVLAAVLGLAAARSTLAGGVVLLFSYSLGLGVPFLVTGLAFGRLTSVYARARRGLWIIHLLAGGILVGFGVLLLAGQLGWLSSQFSDLLNHLGLHRLTSS